jgi:hypothetical protein
MSAYVISELDVRDPVAIETYRTIAANSIAQYGGRYLVRNGAASVAEGEPPPKNIVVVEFAMAAEFCGIRALGGPPRRYLCRRASRSLKQSELRSGFWSCHSGTENVVAKLKCPIIKP